MPEGKKEKRATREQVTVVGIDGRASLWPLLSPVRALTEALPCALLFSRPHTRITQIEESS